MKNLLATIAIAGAACLTACSPGGAGPAPSSAPPSASSNAEVSNSADASGPSGGTEGTPSSATAGSVKESCELFNSLYAEYAATGKDDADGKSRPPRTEPARRQPDQLRPALSRGR